jgi:uncharacterized protein (DUF1015 family)
VCYPPYCSKFQWICREQAREQVESGAAEAAFFMRGTPVEQVRDVAGAGESMPPKSTYFFPKVLTGMLFNPLSD